MSKPTKIILDRQSDLILTNAKIVGATGIVKSDLPGLVDDLARLNTAISAEESARISDVSAEEASRISGDASLSGEISVERGRIDAILDGSDVNLDQFREVVDFVQSIDLTNDNALLTAVTNINSDISAEEAARIAGDSQLSSDLADLQSYVDTTVDSAIATLTSDLADETSRAEAAETAIQSDLDAYKASNDAAIAEEHAHHTAAEVALQAAIDAETAARIAADLTIDDKIADIISNTDLTAIDSFTEVVDNLDAEIARAEAAETALQSDLLDEETRAMAAEVALQAAIDAETAARIAADLTIDGKIADVIANTDLTAIDSFKEVVDNLDAEILRATAAELVLTNALSQEISDRESAIETEHEHHLALDSAVNARIDQEIIDRTADVNVEEARAIAAEAALQSAIDAEAAARIAADSSLNSALISETTRAIAAEGAIYSELTSEVTRATAAESVLTNDLSQEVSNRESAISAEEAARIAGDTQLTTDLSNLQTYVDVTVNQAIVDLNTAIDTEETARVEADNTLRTDLDSEVIRATAAEGVLQTNIDTEKGRIDAILQGSDVNLDQFSEVVAFVQSIDLNAEGSLLDAVTTINQTIQQEVDRATQSENELSYSVTDLDNRLGNVETNLNDLPGVDDSTVEVGPGNVIRLKDQVNAPDSGSRTFGGVLKMNSEPSNDVNFDDLSLVTKQYAYGLFQTEALRAEEVENNLLTDMVSAEGRLDSLEAGFNGLPLADETSIHYDEPNNVMKLADSIEPGTNGIRTFSGVIKVNAEPSSDINFDDLSLVTKQYAYGLFQTEALRAEDVENSLLSDMVSAEGRLDNLEAGFNSLPLADETSIHYDEPNNVMKLADNVEAGTNGIRNFGGVIKVNAEPSSDVNFDDLTLVTKQYTYGLFQTEALRAEEVENSLLSDMVSAEGRLDNLETGFNNLPLVDGSTLILDEINNVIKLGDNVAVGASGVRTFDGVIKVNAEPSLDTNFDDLSLVTKGWVSINLGEDVTQITSDLNAEIIRATAAEGVLQTNIDTEKGRIDAILQGSDVNLDQFAEVVSFVQSIDMTNDDALLNAVTNINSAIDAEEDRAMAAESALQSAIDAEEDRAIAAESALQSAIDAEAAARFADVNSEESRAMAAEAALQSAIDAEAAARIAADLTIDDKIADIISNTDLTAIDSFTEVVSNLDAEIARAEAAEAALSSDLADLQSYVDTTVDSAISQLTSDLADETAARIADVDAEETRAIAAEGVLQSNITTEANERAAEDITLQGNIDIEASRAQVAETAIAADLGLEIAARIAADSAEESRATAAEFLLTTNLSNEVNRATAAEEVLQDNIDIEKGRIDAILIGASANADNFAEIVAIINSVDTENDSVFAGYVLSNDAALAAEETRAIAAEGVLTSDLNAEEARAIAAEGVLTSDLNTEVLRATAAEGVLTSALSAEEVSRIAGDESLQSSLNNEIADRLAAVQSTQTALDNESSRAIAAEGVLTAAISSEVTRATAAELSLATDFANIYSKKVIVNGTSNGTLTTFTLNIPVRIGSEMIYINGLLMEEGEDYTTTITSGKVSGIEFLVAPISEMKVRAYGVC